MEKNYTQIICFVDRIEGDNYPQAVLELPDIEYPRLIVPVCYLPPDVKEGKKIKLTFELLD